MPLQLNFVSVQGLGSTDASLVGMRAMGIQKVHRGVVGIHY